MNFKRVLLIAAFSVGSLRAQEGAIGNQDIVKMIKVGLNERLIIAVINSEASNAFDTSPNGIRHLKKARVSDDIIAAMQAPHRPSATTEAQQSKNSEAHPAGFPWPQLIVQCSGAFIGATFAFGFALGLTHRQRRDASTATMIEEFSSPEMLTSRFVTANLARQVENGEISIRDIALSAVQGCPQGFVGKTIGELTEHQHMSYLIGWIRRLAVQLQHRWVNRRIIATALGGSLQWSMPFLLELSKAAEAVMKEFPSARPPIVRASWISAVRYLDAQLERAKFHEVLPKL